MHTKHQVLFVQGGGEGVHDEWDDKLVESLRSGLGPQYEVRYPRMPREAEPDYSRWKSALEGELAALNDGAILVGHSIGGTMLIHVLAEHPPAWAVGAIFLVAAPFVGGEGWQVDGWNPPRELGARLPPDVPVYLYHGLADDTAPPSHAELFAHAIPHAHVCYVSGRDHQFNGDLGGIAKVIRSLVADAAP
jgi:predicted alpha/beta hydrolase family esterase